MTKVKSIKRKNHKQRQGSQIATDTALYDYWIINVCAFSLEAVLLGTDTATE